MHFDILNHLGVDHKQDGRTNGQTNRTSISNSTV